ncbi:ROK family protein [Auraticoccus monumenti]|uniref:Glucokinase n=1 Tax=Auraticoccus monumenti TaxID=675864 RepID=A0A1G7E6T1_9ACTN|nr:ROK family protein [Auraticoccus monumenti]SDE59319.1 glucokinase [Auraticoccus monumenti]
MDDAVVAVDIGGTKVAMAVVAADGQVLFEDVVPTGTGEDPEQLWQPIGAALAGLLDGVGDVLGEETRVGIGSAGPVHGPEGLVSPVNIPAWRRWPVRDRVLDAVVRATGRPATGVLAGDGHCIAVGEHWLGAGRDVSSMVGMVISTGVGGGAVIDDVLFAGATGNAVHIGHTSVNFLGERCACGSHGCVELYARGPGMVAAARERGWVGEDAQQLTLDAREGDPVAREAIERGMRALAAGVAELATNLDVTTFVIGGGVSKAGEVVFEPLRRHLADFAVLHYVDGLEVRPAELENAGLLGAAAVALALTGRGPLRQAPPSGRRTPSR